MRVANSNHPVCFGASCRRDRSGIVGGGVAREIPTSIRCVPSHIWPPVDGKTGWHGGKKEQVNYRYSQRFVIIRAVAVAVGYLSSA